MEGKPVSEKENRLLVFVGSYSEADQEGLHVFELDEQSGQLSGLSHYAGLKNPTFLNVDADKGVLYAIAETTNEAGNRVGSAAAYRIDASAGTLASINSKTTVESSTCHIQRDKEGRYAIVASYHGGMIGLISLLPDGGIGELLDVQQHEGGSLVDPEVQDRPHPHSSFFSHDERFLLVQDLGKDQIIVYRFDPENGKLILHSAADLPPGAGPRHLTFHPNGKFVYAINELKSSVSAFSFDSVEGKLEPIETVSTLPETFEGESYTAEIAISKDGRFVYGSNRGHDSIVVFSVDTESGKLAPIQHISVEGGHPRHFALTPNGNYLIAANRDGNNLVTFRIDGEQGTLESTGYHAQVSKPVCVVPTYFSV
ncbi:lactonase family protein [Paenibacillus sp. GCM10027627]|uniref:lactonase family protein n=1 Tax=unclassified Paenibacillus TaxID=185978 RepID=UPI00362A2C65